MSSTETIFSPGRDEHRERVEGGRFSRSGAPRDQQGQLLLDEVPEVGGDVGAEGVVPDEVDDGERVDLELPYREGAPLLRDLLPVGEVEPAPVGQGRVHDGLREGDVLSRGVGELGDEGVELILSLELDVGGDRLVVAIPDVDRDSRAVAADVLDQLVAHEGLDLPEVDEVPVEVVEELGHGGRRDPVAVLPRELPHLGREVALGLFGRVDAAEVDVERVHEQLLQALEARLLGLGEGGLDDHVGIALAALLFGDCGVDVEGKSLELDDVHERVGLGALGELQLPHLHCAVLADLAGLRELAWHRLDRDGRGDEAPGEPVEEAPREGYRNRRQDGPGEEGREPHPVHEDRGERKAVARSREGVEALHG